MIDNEYLFAIELTFLVLFTVAFGYLLPFLLIGLGLFLLFLLFAAWAS